MTDVLILASPSFPRLGLLGRVFALQNLHPRLLVAADDQFAVLVELGCVDIQLTDPLSFGVEIGIMAVEPVDTLVRLEVGLFEDAPDGRTTDRFVMGLVDDVLCDVIKAPACGRTPLVGRIAAGNRNDVQVRIGGKRPAVGRIAGHLEGREGPARHSGFAITRPCGDCSRAHRRSGHWTDRPASRPARRSVFAWPAPGVWNLHARGTQASPVLREPTRSSAKMEMAWPASLPEE